MEAKYISDKFQKGHIYFSETRQGKIRLFEVLGVFKNSNGDRTSVLAKYDGKEEKKYFIKTNRNGGEYVIVDNRFCTVVDTMEIVDELKITDDMVSEVHMFNNCGNCIVTVNGKRYKASFDHGTVIADTEIENAFRKYIYG